MGAWVRGKHVCLKNITAILITISFLASVIIPAKSYGWGKDGHELIASVGVQYANLGSQFWKANKINIIRLSTVPDFLWKRGQTYRPETLTHFFQPDSYFTDPSQFNQIPRDFQRLVQKFGLEMVVKEGTAPWRILQFYNAGVISLKKKDFQTAVIAAGVMAHYIGDLSQPLHVTENYDGQKTNNPGIHKFFETTLVRASLSNLAQTVPALTQKLFLDPVFRDQFKGTVVDVVFNELFRAYALKDQLIKIDKANGRTGPGTTPQLELAKQRLADGAATLALVLSHMWEEGGQNDTGATGNIQAPNWIQPNYYEAASIRYDDGAKIQACVQNPGLVDDCH